MERLMFIVAILYCDLNVMALDNGLKVQVPFVQLCVQEKSQVSDITRMASASQVHLKHKVNANVIEQNINIFILSDSKNFISHCNALVWKVT
ncbi:uncharacterized [Tachysurus ichikawai]